MERRINWQNWKLNVRLQDLTQLAAFQHKLQEGCQEQDKQTPSIIMGVPNRTQTGKGIPIRTLLRGTQELLKLKRNQLRWVRRIFFFFYGATARYRALASLIKPHHSRLDSRFRETYTFLR
jgi:hypothetical protein